MIHAKKKGGKSCVGSEGASIALKQRGRRTVGAEGKRGEGKRDKRHCAVEKSPHMAI